MTNDSRPYTCARGNPLSLSLSLSLVRMMVIRAGQGVASRRRCADARVHVHARQYSLREWTLGVTYESSGHTKPAIRLPIQHVQPSTCADTINQIN